MTGWNTEASGTAESGDWVTDGTRFYLVDRSGGVLAATLVTVRCGETRPSWFPLEVGNEWTYFSRTRQFTGRYETARVVGTYLIDGYLWFDVDGGPFHHWLLREDDQGRVWRYNDFAAMPPELVVDPTTGENPEAYFPTRPGPVAYSQSGPIETLASPFVQGAPLEGRTANLGKNIGLLELTLTMISGSSGGFLAGFTLVRARIGGKVEYDSPELSLSLGVESQRVTLRPGEVGNCAVPCYFVACGLVPGADPPDTFKPCMRARLTLNGTLPGGATAQLRLTNANGETVFQTNPASAGFAGDSLFVQLPLYTAPNRPLPPGAYLLSGSADTAAGPLTASIPVQVLE